MFQKHEPILRKISDQAPCLILLILKIKVKVHKCKIKENLTWDRSLRMTYF